MLTLSGLWRTIFLNLKKAGPTEKQRKNFSVRKQLFLLYRQIHSSCAELVHLLKTLCHNNFMSALVTRQKFDSFSFFTRVKLKWQKTLKQAITTPGKLWQLKYRTIILASSTYIVHHGVYRRRLFGRIFPHTNFQIDTVAVHSWVYSSQIKFKVKLEIHLFKPLIGKKNRLPSFISICFSPEKPNQHFSQRQILKAGLNLDCIPFDEQRST